MGCIEEVTTNTYDDYSTIGTLETDTAIYCYCDSNDCNHIPLEENPNQFSCYSGDLSVNDLSEAYYTIYQELKTEYSYEKASCYTNRDQCFQLNYPGKVKYTDLKSSYDIAIVSKSV